MSKIKKFRLIWQIHFLFSRRFRHLSLVNFKHFRYIYCNKQIKTHENGNIQFDEQEENKLNSTINLNNGANTLTHDKIAISPLKKNNTVTIKRNWKSNKYLTAMTWQIDVMVPIQCFFSKMVHFSVLIGFLSLLVKSFYSQVLEN